VVRAVLLCVILYSVAACNNAGEPTGRIRADALVTTGAEGCKVSLLIGNQRYEPIGLPDSLAVVGIVLRVDGVVRDRPSICMIGPGLELSAVSRISS
jgi:hypothetical protein